MFAGGRLVEKDRMSQQDAILASRYISGTGGRTATARLMGAQRYRVPATGLRVQSGAPAMPGPQVAAVMWGEGVMAGKS